MKIQHWTVIATIMAVLVFTGAAIWETARQLKISQAQALQKHAVKEATLLRRSVQTHVDAVNYSLRSMPESESDLQGLIYKSVFLAVSDFVVGSDGQWKPQWLVSQSSAFGKDLTAMTRLAADLPFARVSKESTAWTRVLDDKGLPYIVVMSSAKTSGVVRLAFLPIQFFADLNQAFKSGSDEVFIVDNRGLALGYADQEYLGASLQRHPLISQLVGQQNLKATGEFRNFSADYLVGAYEQVANTNLYVAIAVPAMGQVTAAENYGLTFLFMGLGFALFLAALLWVMVKPSMDKLEYLKGAVLNIAAGQTPKPSDVFGAHENGVRDALMRLASQSPLPVETRQMTPQNTVLVNPKSTKVSAYDNEEVRRDLENDVLKKVGGSLAASLKGPLSAILGHAQMARTLSQEKNLRQHFTVIEREARRGRDIVENLNRFVGVKDFKRQKSDLQDVVLTALGVFKETLADQHVKVSKSLSTDRLIDIDVKAVQQAVEQVIGFSLGILNAAGPKEMNFDIEPKGQSLTLKIYVPSATLPEGDFNRVFDPFYSLPGYSDMSGMGLSVAKGLVTAMGGEIFLDIDNASGATFVISFPTIDGDRLQTALDLKTSVTAHAVVPSKESDAPYPNVPGDSSKLKPLTGSSADGLPVAPAPDEMTFAGELPDDEDEVVMDVQEEEAPELALSVSENGAEDWKAVDTHAESSEVSRSGAIIDEEAEEFQVVIRPPKVRVEN
ncbi:MAG: sensor histidine kinase [Pseudobdellovibrionaceae bacterium]|nr:sensor histidine kinase [Bdellovibrionales bacterium]USN46353.1 MAG: sensor histidine kinase [Pseudobdellovibrionaceae bacterium]